MVELSKQNRKAGPLFAMKIITQTMRFRQAVIEYSDQHDLFLVIYSKSSYNDKYKNTVNHFSSLW